MTFRLEPIDVLEKAIHIGSSGFRVKIFAPTSNTFLIDLETVPVLVWHSLNRGKTDGFHDKNVV